MKSCDKKSGLTLVELLVGASIVLIVIATALPLFGGCKKIEQNVKHIKSGFVGLDRTVTLYAYDGIAITNWSGNINVETVGGVPRFILDGKTIYINGTYTIVEN